MESLSGMRVIFGSGTDKFPGVVVGRRDGANTVLIETERGAFIRRLADNLEPFPGCPTRIVLKGWYDGAARNPRWITWAPAGWLPGVFCDKCGTLTREMYRSREWWDENCTEEMKDVPPTVTCRSCTLNTIEEVYFDQGFNTPDEGEVLWRIR